MHIKGLVGHRFLPHVSQVFSENMRPVERASITVLMNTKVYNCSKASFPFLPLSEIRVGMNQFGFIWTAPILFPNSSLFTHFSYLIRFFLCDWRPRLVSRLTIRITQKLKPHVHVHACDSESQKNPLDQMRSSGTADHNLEGIAPNCWQRRPSSAKRSTIFKSRRPSEANSNFVKVYWEKRQSPRYLLFGITLKRTHMTPSTDRIHNFT
jgi:hypothetical protein